MFSSFLFQAKLKAVMFLSIWYKNGIDGTNFHFQLLPSWWCNWNDWLHDHY